MAVLELDLELDAAEKRRRRGEDEAVDAGREIVREPGTAIGVRLRGRDDVAVLPELHRHPDAGLSGAGVEHMGREGAAHGANLRASMRCARAISCSSA